MMAMISLRGHNQIQEFVCTTFHRGTAIDEQQFASEGLDH